MLLGEEKTSTINKHKEDRIDAQHYMKVGKKEQVQNMLQEAKMFVAMFDNLVSGLSEEEINAYRISIRKYEQ